MAIDGVVLAFGAFPARNQVCFALQVLIPPLLGDIANTIEDIKITVVNVNGSMSYFRTIQLRFDAFVYCCCEIE